MEGRMHLHWEGAFDSAHRLYDYDGKCSRLHGHRWTVKADIGIDAVEYKGDGISVDFNELKAVMDKYDHRYLNEDIEVFKGLSPSAENIVQILANDIEDALRGKQGNPKLIRLEVFETPKNSVVLEY